MTVELFYIMQYLRDKKRDHILKVVFNDDRFRNIPHLFERVVKACDGRHQGGDWQKHIWTFHLPLKLAKTSRKPKLN